MSRKHRRRSRERGNNSVEVNQVNTMDNKQQYPPINPENIGFNPNQAPPSYDQINAQSHAIPQQVYYPQIGNQQTPTVITGKNDEIL
jgi:hypothetical protein